MTVIIIIIQHFIIHKRLKSLYNFVLFHASIFKSILNHFIFSDEAKVRMTLPTPNLVLPESAGFNLSSPRQYKIKPTLIGSDRAPSNGDREIMVKEENTEDMLTTPVLTTPKTGDLWSHLRIGAMDGRSPPGIIGNRLELAHNPHAFSPENLTVTSPTPIEIGPREPPNDLPMDSEIGLRSPCDGLLAQRRRERFRDKKQVSSLDSNSLSDTPVSENNSPRDLTMGSSRLRLGSSKSESEKSSADGTSAGCDNSGASAKSSNSPTSTTSPTGRLSNPTSSNTNSIQAESPSNGTLSSTLTNSNHNNNVLSGNKPPNIEVQEHGGRVLPSTNSRSPISSHLQQNDFKLPSKKVENLRIFSGNTNVNGLINGKDGTDSNSSDHPGHYTPSPLAVPSPNWTAVERYFGGEYVLRTPRLLDNSVFDFLNPPNSASGGGRSWFPRSPGNESERYLGRDQRLSPRLSPRFPIPEAPTDLSSGSNSRSASNGVRRAGDPPPYAEAAEDLSMSKRQQKKIQAGNTHTQPNSLRVSSSPHPGDSDSTGGGPASNTSSTSPVTPHSPLIHPPQSNSIPQQNSADNINRPASTSPINGIQNLLSKTNMSQQNHPNVISRTEPNQQSHQPKVEYNANTKQPQVQQHTAMQLHSARIKTEPPHLSLPADIHHHVSIPTHPVTNIPIKPEVEEFEYSNSEQHHHPQHTLQQRQAQQAAVALATNTSAGFGNPYYITQGFSSLYNRAQNQSIYSGHMDGQRPSPPTSAPPPKISPPPPLITGGNHLPPHTRMSIDYNRQSVSPYSSSHSGHRLSAWSTNPSQGTHVSQHPQAMPQCQPNSNVVGNIQTQGLQHQWTTPSHMRTDDDASISPPSHHFNLERGGISSTAGISVKPTTTLLNRNQGLFSGNQNGSLSAEKKRGRKPGGPIAHDAINQRDDRKGEGSHGDHSGPPKIKQPRKSGNKKGPIKVEGEEDGNGGNKRSYSCPHCQRSYDWNYNLNRHLKYECGKENAFQCAKCGRRFPHKQNCVYHLKRKHKIVCETIDQYVAAGLVVFHGNSNSSGQGSAKTQEANILNNSGILPVSVSQAHNTQLQPISTTMAPTRVA